MMKELLDLIASPWAFVAVLLIFGFAPRLVLRVLVLAFHRDDPRRLELLGELDAVSYSQRPLFVVEQLEIALSEGLGGRIRFLWLRKVTSRWSLTDGVAMNQQHPTTFEVPDEETKDALEPGDLVKLGFVCRDDWGERMWVRIEKKTRRGFVGRLSNTPVGVPDLWPDKKIRFKREHILDVSDN